MTKEEKQLLFKDLCARLPYGVKAELHGEVCTVLGYYNDFDFDDFVILTSNTPTGQQTNIANIKPYLRPMSSMTDEETDTYDRMVMCNASWVVDDWLLSHHFDYRGLIEKGLALEVTEENNPYI